MTDLHQTRTIPASDVQVGWEVHEQGEWVIVTKREDHASAVILGMGSDDNGYFYANEEVLTVRLPVSRFIVEVRGCTPAQAAQVMAERLGHDEDYGFTYSVDWAVTS